MKTMVKPSLYGIIFYKSSMEVVLAPHSNPVVIKESINDWRINRVLVNEGSTLSLLYLNCW